jgi:hypothetical protein
MRPKTRLEKTALIAAAFFFLTGAYWIVFPSKALVFHPGYTNYSNLGMTYEFAPARAARFLGIGAVAVGALLTWMVSSRPRHNADQALAFSLMQVRGQAVYRGPGRRQRRLTRKALIGTVLFVLPLVAGGGAWWHAEMRWSELNSPSGKFATAQEYLAAGRLPSRVTVAWQDDHRFVIAYSPMDHGLALPFGPAAYVFDQSGDLVGWSGESAGDRKFKKRWPQKKQEEATLDELRKLGAVSE